MRQTYDVERLHQEFERGTSLLKLEGNLGEDYYRIFRRIKTRSESDPVRWNPDRVVEYGLQRDEIRLTRRAGYLKRYRKEHSAERAAYNAQRYQKNRSRILARRRQRYWGDENYRDKILAKNRGYRRENRERILAGIRKKYWKDSEHREKVLAQNRQSKNRRRMRELMPGINKPELVFGKEAHIPDNPLEPSFPQYIAEFLEANVGGLELELGYTQHVKTKNIPHPVFGGKLTKFSNAHNASGLEGQILEIISDGQTYKVHSREIDSLSGFWNNRYNLIYARR